MTLVPLLLSLALLAGADGADDPLRPARVMRLPGGPTIVQVETPAPGLVSVRLSVALREAPSEAGAAGVLQRLALARMRTLATNLAARVEAHRTPWGLSYSVTAARADFEHLAWILREATSEPDPDALAYQRAREAVRTEADRLLETPRGILDASLRDRAFPTLPPLHGTAATLDSLSVEDLRAFWARTHRRGAMTLVVAGDVPPEVLQAAFQDVGSSAGPAGRPVADSVPGQARRPSADILRTWYAEAHLAGEPADPHSAVVARLAARRLEGAGDYEAWVELWEMDGWKVIVLTGAAHRAHVAAMRGRVGGLLAEMAGSVSEDQVGRAVSETRQEILAEARTPWGLVAVVGRHLDATGDPEGADRYVATLGRVSRRSVAAFLDRLTARTPLRAEATP